MNKIHPKTATTLSKTLIAPPFVGQVVWRDGDAFGVIPEQTKFGTTRVKVQWVLAGVKYADVVDAFERIEVRHYSSAAKQIKKAIDKQNKTRGTK